MGDKIVKPWDVYRAQLRRILAVILAGIHQIDQALSAAICWVLEVRHVARPNVISVHSNGMYMMHSSSAGIRTLVQVGDHGRLDCSGCWPSSSQVPKAAVSLQSHWLAVRLLL